MGIPAPPFLLPKPSLAQLVHQKGPYDFLCVLTSTKPYFILHVLIKKLISPCIDQIQITQGYEPRKDLEGDT